MNESNIIRVDAAAANMRILAQETKTDFRRIEAASVKVMTHFMSADGKRHFVRYFHTLQLNVHFISVVARTKLRADAIMHVETLLREQLVAAAEQLNEAIDGAEALLKANGITHVATYNTLPLQIEVGVISSAGRRYFEIMNKFDQLMPLLQTLEIHEVISPGEADDQRGVFKKLVRKLAIRSRHAASDLRRRMQDGGAVNKPRAPKEDGDAG